MNKNAEQSRFSVAQNALAVAQSALALAQGSLAAAEDQSRSEVLERIGARLERAGLDGDAEDQPRSEVLERIGARLGRAGLDGDAEDQPRSEVLDRPLPPVPSQLKLFVWPDFKADFTSGLAFAIARDESDARYAVLSGMSLEDREYDADNGGTDWGAVVVLALNSTIGFARIGGS